MRPRRISEGDKPLAAQSAMHGVDAVYHYAYGRRSHGFHGLAHGGERGGVNGGGCYVIEADHGALFGHSDSGLIEGADRTEGAHVVERQQGREGALLAYEFFGELAAGLETGKWIAGFRQIQNQAGIEFHAGLLCQVADAAPAR